MPTVDDRLGDTLGSNPDIAHPAFKRTGVLIGLKDEILAVDQRVEEGGSLRPSHGAMLGRVDAMNAYLDLDERAKAKVDLTNKRVTVDNALTSGPIDVSRAGHQPP